MIGLEVFRKIYSAETALTICDVGAHWGESVSEFISLFPKSRVFAFEPDRDNWTKLSERYLAETRVQIFDIAVGQEDGRGLLHRNNYDATHSLLPFNAKEINRWADASDFHEEGVEKVNQLTLDTFCSIQGIESIDILKLDIQGAELMALKGAAVKLRSQAIGCIFCEVEFRPIYEGQPLFWDISTYLMSHGYHFFNIVSPKVTEMGVISWADAVYVNGKLWDDIAARHSAGHLIS